MSININRAEVGGYVAREPEIVTMQQSGRKVARLTVGTTDRAWTKKDGTLVPERTEWHDISLFGSQAEFAEKYIHKGNAVLVVGKIHHNKVTGKDGVVRYFDSIDAYEIHLLDKSQQAQARQQQQTQQWTQPAQQQLPPWQEQQGMTASQNLFGSEDYLPGGNPMDNIPF